MRIAFFVSAFPVVSETFILNQITGLIDRGHEVDIYARGRRPMDVVHPEIVEYRLLDRVFYLSDIPKSIFGRITYLMRLLSENKAFTEPGMWKQTAQILSASKIQSYVPKLAQLTIALKQVKDGPYDIVHSQYGTLSRRLIVLKETGLLPAKHVTSFRGHDITQHANSAQGFYDELFEKGDLFLPVSNSLKQRIVFRGCDEKKIEILHSGINCERFCYQPRELKNGEAVKIFTVARLVEMKGVAYGIKAVAQLIKSGRKICYKIAGDGALREELERLIKELGMENSIQLLGWKGHKELPGLMDDTHILLTPSVTAANGEQEGIPNVVKEAMAMGIPVVGTLHSGIPELVENGVSGYLAPERDSQMLAECLAKLIDQSDRWPEIGKAGRQKVELEFDMNKLNDKLVELYRSVAT